ncbi:carbohydrate-binding protein [Streptomyces sp. NPDC051940]|uniref:carbohydrate-binding protein n=1 Tax=Streptomyces sp. NPDC051940 TaxID=3155675 RepID=UPI00342E1362
MTDGYSGGSGGQPPADDDPFAHLYRTEGGAAPVGDTAPIGQAPGVPRTSYNHVRAVGERQYGQQPYGGQQTYAGQPPANAHYAAPETYGGGPGRPYPPQDDDYDDRRGPQRNPLVLGAVAFVAVVVIAIAVAMMSNGDDDKDKGSQASNSPAPTATSGDDKKKDEAKDEDTGELPKSDAADLTLSGGAVVGTEYPDAKSGSYVTGFNAPGAQAVWKIKVPEDGQYHVYVRFSVPGKDTRLPVLVDGKPYSNGINMENWSGAKKGEWGKWSTTFITPTLSKGEHEIVFYSDKGGIDTAIDQVALTTEEVAPF